MRIELLEKVVTVFAVVAIVIVATMVGVFSFVIPRSSGISAEEANADQEVIDWLAMARRIANGQPATPVNIQPIFVSAPAAGGVAVKPGQPNAPATPPPALPPGVSNVAKPGETIPVDQQVPGIPWLRQQPGVSYYQPQEISNVQYQRLQGFDEAFQAAQAGAGEFVNGKYKITWVDPNNGLAQKVGLQPGDQIISVNGLPVGNSFNANRQLYDSLKGQHQFAVLVNRGGQNVMLSFYH